MVPLIVAAAVDEDYAFINAFAFGISDKIIS